MLFRVLPSNLDAPQQFRRLVAPHRPNDHLQLAQLNLAAQSRPQTIPVYRILA
jgi:hypothetical protein